MVKTLYIDWWALIKIQPGQTYMLVTDSAISAQKSSTSWSSLFKAKTLTSSSGSLRSDRMPAAQHTYTPHSRTEPPTQAHHKPEDVTDIVYIATPPANSQKAENTAHPEF